MLEIAGQFGVSQIGMKFRGYPELYSHAYVSSSFVAREVLPVALEVAVFCGAEQRCQIACVVVSV